MKFIEGKEKTTTTELRLVGFKDKSGASVEARVAPDGEWREIIMLSPAGAMRFCLLNKAWADLNIKADRAGKIHAY